MQKINRELLIETAEKLLQDGTVNRVLGWKKGDFSYDLPPAVFTSLEDLKENFVFNDFSGANFSKYLIKETKSNDGKVLVFLKPCDTYSFNQLLTEHRFDKEKVYAVGIACDGMIDVKKIKELVGDGILRGSGTMKLFMVATFTDLVLRVVLAFLFAPIWGYMGIWYSWPIGWTTATVLSLIFYFVTMKKFSKS